MKFNIAYAPDDKYINQTIVSMVSAIENNKEDEIEFIIIYSKLCEKNIDKLNSVKGCKLRLLQVDETPFSTLPLSNWVTVQSWFRIKLPDMCPDLDKILYLDCDTLILGNLEELFKTDLNEKYLAGVLDIIGAEKFCKRLDMTSGAYINTGMILLNAEYCRKENFFDKIVDFANNNAKIIEFCDQDSINKIADEKKVIIHPKFNFMDMWWNYGYYELHGKEEQKYLNAKKNPVVVHFLGPKPAFKGCNNRFKDKWWEYAKLTNIFAELKEDYENSKEPKEPLKDKIFSIKNKYTFNKVKIKILTILGFHFIISKKEQKKGRFIKTLGDISE